MNWLNAPPNKIPGYATERLYSGLVDFTVKCDPPVVSEALVPAYQAAMFHVEVEVIFRDSGLLHRL